MGRHQELRSEPWADRQYEYQVRREFILSNSRMPCSSLEIPSGFQVTCPPAIGANIQRKAQYLSSCSRTREVCRKHSSAHPAGIKADENIQERSARTAFVGYLRRGTANMPGLLNQTRRVNCHGSHGQDACVVHNPVSQNVTHSRFFADFDVFFSYLFQ